MKWHLNSAQAVRVRGASDAAATPTRLRRSDDFLQFDFFGELQARFDATIALDDAAPPLLAVAGSHRLPKHALLVSEASSALPISLAKGDILLSAGHTLTAFGPPESGAGGCFLCSSYSPAYLCEEELQILSNPPELARTYPIALQRLCGWMIYGGSLGYWGSRQHPVEAFNLAPVDFAATRHRL